MAEGSDAYVDSSRAVTYKDVHCISCQRNGKKAKGEYYCQDCRVGLCRNCANKHTEDVKMNRHSVSVVSKTFQVSPNQGPFPELTEIGTIKFDVAKCIRGSAFLPNGELAVTDFNNSKILLFSSDYTRKVIGKITLPKQTDWGERPKPVGITAISQQLFASTANNGCVYVIKICQSMILQVERVIPVISFVSNHGECPGIAFNSLDQKLYAGCTSDREGDFIKVYDLNGNPCRDVRSNISGVPTYLKFGVDRKKLIVANSDDVKVYNVENFEIVDEYEELQAQTKDVIVDKWGYLYTLALERRLLKHPGSIYRLDPKTGVTKVTSVNDKPSSIAYCFKTDDVAVTFEDSRYIYLYKLRLRSFQKQFGNDLRPYKE